MIKFENVHKTYKSKSGPVEALRGVSFDIDDGEFVFVIGKSGSGKSTLLKCITCEERPTEGGVFMDGFNIATMPRALVPVLRRQIGMIYQDFRLIESKTVFENVAFAGEIIGIPSKSLAQSVNLMLNVVGLKDKANSYPQELSGGEQQRVAIARAMINNPKLIVADEPTGNLDPEISENIMALLQEINRNGSTVIVCTHDSNLVDRMKKRVIEISEGLVARDAEGSAYNSSKSSVAPAPAPAASAPVASIAFGDDPAFEQDREYHDNYDDDAYSSNIPSDFYFGETPVTATAPAIVETPEEEVISEESLLVENDIASSEEVIEEVSEEEIIEEGVFEEVEEVAEEVIPEADDAFVVEEKVEPEEATEEDNTITEINLSDIDLDIQEDDE